MRNAVGTKSVRQKIAEYLKEGNTITPDEAVELFGCTWLARAAYIMRVADGLNVVSDKTNVNGKNTSIYFIKNKRK